LLLMLLKRLEWWTGILRFRKCPAAGWSPRTGCELSWHAPTAGKYFRNKNRF
jgi:hypothetical protein